MTEIAPFVHTYLGVTIQHEHHDLEKRHYYTVFAELQNIGLKYGHILLFLTKNIV